MQVAARQLNVTPPAVSQAIKALESDLGVKLLDRSAKPAVPTEAGERLHRATRTGLGLIEDTIEDIQMAAGLGEQQINLSCTLGMATHWLMPRLPLFYALYPDVTVNVQTPPSDLPMLTGGIDIALRYGDGLWRDCETEMMFPETVCPVGRPDVIDACLAAGGISEAFLIDVRLRSNKPWAGWSDYLRANDIARPKRAMQVFDNYVQAVQAALNGHGVMLGWRSITSTLVTDGALKAWPDGDHDFGTAYYVSCDNASLHKQAVQGFRDWVVDLVRQEDENALCEEEAAR